METEGVFSLVLWVHSNAETGEPDSLGFASFTGTIPARVLEYLYQQANKGMAAFWDYPLLELDCWHDCICEWSIDDAGVNLVLTKKDAENDI